jgi:hypothetical protein
MKTEEDEAFDELARKQGSWGGGFKAKQAMAADKLQEPVAWTLLLTGKHHGIIGAAGEKFIGAPEHYERVDVYTTSPQRPWVGLTDAEIKKICDCTHGYDADERIARAIEAKLKEKNT